MAEAWHAVFLSYASQDVNAAQKIAEALRAGMISSFCRHNSRKLLRANLRL